jgi:ribosomal protein L19E
MIVDEDVYLEHYGILRKSGRYPWGSGEDVESRSRDFKSMVDDLKKQGIPEVTIAEGFGMTTTELRNTNTVARNAIKQADIATAQRLKNKGLSNTAIGLKMGKNESVVRSLLAPGEKDKSDILTATADALRAQVAEKKYIDVGTGVERHMNISDQKLRAAISMLKDEGYTMHYVKVPQLGTSHFTTVKVLAAPGVKYSEVFRARDQIQQPFMHTEDGGRSWLGLYDPISIDPKRVGINYKEDGGDQADGVIFVRPGVPDISMGASRYAQVRVKVGDSHYLKGMAMYKDDLPDGVDLVFNTNKSDTGNKLDALKKLKDDPDNPFGAVVRQIVRRKEDGKEFVTGYGAKDASSKNVEVVSAMNLVNEEGDWGKWSKTLSTQMLSKQSPSLAKKQLDMTYEDRLKEYEEISSLTNPVVRKKLLETFGDETDSAGVHLKAKALPDQASHVILPISSMPPGQIYAPKYKDGETVVLIRYPHGGTFEIPELVVNNRHREAKRLLKDAHDAVGIHHSVAERLSGADFDGDTVLVIPNPPNTRNRVTVKPALEQLKGFDPKAAYPKYEGMPVMTAKMKQREMGDVSNLITDMTIKGASNEEISRAVRHSMVVIDAEKHELNYKQSAIDLGIKQLKAKYQGAGDAGAATLISRAGSEARVPKRKLRSARNGGPIDKETGKRVYEEVEGNTYVNAKGKTVVSTDKVEKLALTDDAFTLSSGTPMERIYAEHSNKLKALANKARVESINTPLAKQNPSARRTYAPEVASLNAKLAIAIRNRPLERQAQIIANATVKMKQDADPTMDAVQLKKIKGQALNEARLRTGAKKQLIDISESEWNAIQAGALSPSNLNDIINNADIDQVKALATPRVERKLTTAKTSRAHQMLASGYTRAEVASALGVSVSTLDRSMAGE